MEAARAEQVLHNREEIIIIHAATLSARRVRTAMVPAESIAVFDLRRSLKENVAALGPKLHRSYPVSEDGTTSRITGYVRVRELFVRHLLEESPEAPAPDWRQQIRPVLHIDERATLTQLLALFRREDRIFRTILPVAIHQDFFAAESPGDWGSRVLSEGDLSGSLVA